MRDLVNHVASSVVKCWYELGLQLLDPKYESDLEAIETDPKNDAKTSCRKMFSSWLKTDKFASWNKLVEALTSIGMEYEASNIKVLFQGK